MGTRSITVFHETDGTEIAVMYRQFDGYPSGHGQELADFLAPLHIVNGIRVGDERPMANGGGCLAMQACSHFKGQKAGNFYLHAAGTRDRGEEFVYHVYPKIGEPVRMTVAEGCVTAFGLPGDKEDDMKPLYDGPAKDFNGDDLEAA